MLSQSLRKIDKPVEDFNLKNHAAWRTPSKLKKNECCHSANTKRSMSNESCRSTTWTIACSSTLSWMESPFLYPADSENIELMCPFSTTTSRQWHLSLMGLRWARFYWFMRLFWTITKTSRITDKNSICGSIGQIYACCVNSTRHLFSMVFIVLTFDFCILKQILLTIRFYTKTRMRTMQRREVRCLIGQIIWHYQIVIIPFY